jgi:hypothetical protein
METFIGFEAATAEDAANMNAAVSKRGLSI